MRIDLREPKTRGGSGISRHILTRKENGIVGGQLGLLNKKT